MLRSEPHQVFRDLDVELVLAHVHEGGNGFFIRDQLALHDVGTAIGCVKRRAAISWTDSLLG